MQKYGGDYKWNVNGDDRRSFHSLHFSRLPASTRASPRTDSTSPWARRDRCLCDGAEWSIRRRSEGSPSRISASTFWVAARKINKSIYFFLHKIRLFKIRKSQNYASFLECVRWHSLLSHNQSTSSNLTRRKNNVSFRERKRRYALFLTFDMTPYFLRIEFAEVCNKYNRIFVCVEQSVW